MKRLLRYIALTVFGITIAGCGTAIQEIKSKSESVRTDVFSEVKDESAPPKGYVDLVIKASIKTHLEGHYILESKESIHGKPDYAFVINIDGQGVVWKVNGKEESTSMYDEKGVRTSEGGKGMRYILEKRIRLSAGSHRIFFGLTGEDYFREVEIILKQGELHVLEFKPVYKKDLRRIQSFLHGLKEYEVFLDGNIIH